MSTDIKEVNLVTNSEQFTGSFYNIGDKVNGFTIKEKLNTNSGEAEIYFCEKDGKKYIFKSYYKKNIFSDLKEKLTSLNHKNVMKIYAIGKDKKHSYEIDEYYEGGALDSCLPLEESEALKIVEQINEGLKAIHDAGIIHRDIKAENIYFKDSSKKEIVIGDFGIAAIYDQKDDVNEHLTKIDDGTDGYKAPETFNGVISPVVDYYSLGITVWNILTGKTPFIDENGESFTSERIRYETIHDKICETLLANADRLSEKTKKLISGLLVYRHDQRWHYEQVKDFLAGKDIPVFAERRELPAFEFNNKEFFTLKDIAQEMLDYPEEGKKLLLDDRLTNYIDNNATNENQFAKLTSQIVNIKDKFLNSQQKLDDFKDEILGGFNNEEEIKDYVLVRIAYILSKNITFPLTYMGSRYEINSLADFKDLLLQHSLAVGVYLVREAYGLYVVLEALISSGDKSIFDYVREIAKASTNRNNLSILSVSVYLYLNKNQISPFTDKVYGNIVLSEKDDVYKLSQHLKDRLMYLLDKKEKMLVAWFENIFNVNMDDWYGELEGGYSHDDTIASLRRNKIAAYGKWKYFDLFLKGQDLIHRNYYVEGGKVGLLDLNGDILLAAQYEDVHCEYLRNTFIYKTNGIWRVTRKTEDGRYQTVIESKKELSVLKETDKLYKTDDGLWLEGDENDTHVPAIVNTSIGYIEAVSEKNHPNERYINFKNNQYELLDAGFNKLETFERIQQVTANGIVPAKLTFWVVKNGRASIFDKNCNIVEELPYSSFNYVGNDNFIVQNIEGQFSLVDYKNTLLRENVKDFRSLGSIGALQAKSHGKWELINFQDATWAFNNKKFKKVGYLGTSLFVLNSFKKIVFFSDLRNEVVATTILRRGKGGTVINTKGLKKQFVALNIYTIEKALQAQNGNKKYYNILGFDGKSFYKYNFNTCFFEEVSSPTQIYDEAKEELPDLLKTVNSEKLTSFIQKNISKENYNKANELINVTWEYYFEKNDFKTVRYLLSSIRMDKDEGLDWIFLAYKRYLGLTYMRENELLKNCFKTKDLIRRNNNYVFALHYLLSAAGKEIDEHGEIITAPYSQKLNLNPALIMDCAEVCITISQVEHHIYLPYGWTQDYIKKVAVDMLNALVNYYSNEDAVNEQTYISVSRLGDLYSSLNDADTALKLYELGIKYEQGLSLLNESKYFVLLANTQQYKEALAVYDHMKSVYPDIDNDSDFKNLYEFCDRNAKNLGL